MTRFLFAAALSFALAGCNLTQTASLPDSKLPPRDPPYGKGNAGNDTLHVPSGNTAVAQTSGGSDPIPPRDPPYGKAM